MTPELNPMVPVITVDGPSGVGKGTVGMALARQLGFHFLDSGAWYRVLAWAHMQSPVPVKDLSAFIHALNPTYVERDHLWQVHLDNHDITSAIRMAACGQRASELAILKEVRHAVGEKLRAYRRFPGLVADGRDMGTVVFADAPCKFYLTAPPDVRAKRRFNQLKSQGIDANLNALVQDVHKRDARDASRVVAPLKPAEDAMVIDTTVLSVDEVVSLMLDHVRCALAGMVT